jgi:hypothetical protein
MKLRTCFTAALLISVAILPLSVSGTLAQDAAAAFKPHVMRGKDPALELSVLGQYRSGIYRKSAAEIVNFDPASKRAFVINAANREVDVLDLSDPAAPKKAMTINVSDIGADANSVAVSKGLVAIAIEAKVKSDPGFVAFYDTAGKRLSVVQVGALPDAVTFSPDGRWVLTANEGEPSNDYAVDPEGSVSIVDLSVGAANVTQAQVRTADFKAYIGKEDDLRKQGIRIFGPKANAAQDFEPEWVEVSPDSRTAYVSLQENNAIAVIDIASARVTAVHALGFKDWSANGAWSGKGFDAGRSGPVNIRHWPVFGMFNPDTIRLYQTGGETYLVTANEGDARDYENDDWYSEEIELRQLKLDPKAFPNAAELQSTAQLGSLVVTTNMGISNGCNASPTTAEAQAAGFKTVRAYVIDKCVYDRIFAFGARSMAIFKVKPDGLELVFDTGSQFEEITLATQPSFFNADHRDRDQQLRRRSPNKGPEPEGVALGEIDGRSYAFIGLERFGGIMVYDITEPAKTSFVTYINNRDFTLPLDAKAQVTTDLGPEGLHFVPAAQSPDPKGRPVLIVGNEVSGTTTIFAIDRLKK